MGIGPDENPPQVFSNPQPLIPNPHATGIVRDGTAAWRPEGTLVSVNAGFVCLIAVLSIGPGAVARADQRPSPCPPPVAAAGTKQTAEPTDAAPDQDRLLGVLPNYTTVGAHQKAPPLCTKLLFMLATESAFDRNIYPYVGFRALVAQLRHNPESWEQDAEGYGKRYAAIFVDNTVGSYMTTALVPMLAKQDPRYFVKGEGSLWRRTAYAMSRTVITRSRSGATQFNISEVGGNALASSLSNAYYPSEERSVSDTISRWGTMMLWDGVSYELKEFWPDIRRKIFKH